MSSYEVFAEHYDKLTSNINYKKICKYYLSLFERYGAVPSALIDLACGTGSLTREFARAGITVTGVDISPDMLAVARSKTKKGADIEYICQDMRELDLYSKYGGAVCTLDSLNHLLTIEDISSVFARLKYFTEPGGLFIFDMNSDYKHKKILKNNTFVYDAGGVYLVWQNSYNQKRRLVHIELDFFVENGGTYNRYYEDFYEKAYFHEEIVSALESNGFRLVELLGDYTLSIPDEKAERFIYVAKRN